MISVIVPVFNKKNYISQCIESVIKQSYKKIEFLIVDDGSTDDSLEIIKEWEKKDERIRVFSKKNGGQNSARKYGLERAQGEWVFFLDADDYIESAAIEKMYSRVEDDIDAVTCGCITVDGNNHFLGKVLKEGVYSGIELAKFRINVSEYYTINLPLGICPFLYRKKIADKMFNNIDLSIRYGEDLISYLALLDVHKVFFLEERLYNIRKNSESVTRKQTESNYVSQLKIYKYLFDEYSRRRAPLYFKKQLEQIIISNLLIGGYKDAFDYEDGLYPYEGVNNGARVVIYGMGLFGKALKSYLIEKKRIEYLFSVDKNYLLFSDEDIRNPEELKNADFDFILISTLFYDTTEMIVRFLETMGINTSKIKKIEAKMISMKYIKYDQDDCYVPTTIS